MKKQETIEIPVIKILFENANLMVLNKPAGLVVHSDGKTTEPNLCDWLMEKYPEIKNVGEPYRAPDGTTLPRPGIVHRLDRETSGVMIVAKTDTAFAHLKEQFKNRLVHKTYNAFVWGIIGEGERRINSQASNQIDGQSGGQPAVFFSNGAKGVIDRPIGRSKGDFRKWSAGRFARGEMREAVTEYTVLGSRRFSDFKEAGIQTEIQASTIDEIDNEAGNRTDAPKMTPAVSFIEARPLTGRTHQIRVHMHFFHHPVIGDTLYAPNHPRILGFNRLALHARIIEFTDLDGKVVRIEAPLPDDFLKAIEIFEKV